VAASPVHRDTTPLVRSSTTFTGACCAGLRNY
jgi:hypothetical protein